MGRESPRDIEQNAVTSFALRWAAALLCIIFSGCGYTFATTPLSKDYTTIAVPAFKNQTFEEDLQIRFNNILVRELEADGRLRVVNDPAGADLVLGGALTAFDPHAISLVKDDNIGQFRITIVATASLLAARSGEILWRDETLGGTDFYQTQGGRNREEAIDEALEELAERIIYESLDSFW
jgi:hypothetical protein